MPHRQIDRDVSGFDRGKSIRHIIRAPRPILVPGRITHFSRIERRDVMERSRLGVFPSDRRALRVEPGREVMDGSPLEMTVLHIVGTRPEELNWRLGRARNFRRFQCVVDREPSSESSADQGDIYLDVGGRGPEQLRDLFLQSVWRLRGRPDCAAIFSHIGDAVHRLDRRMGVEWIMIGRVDRFRDGSGPGRRFFFAGDEAALA